MASLDGETVEHASAGEAVSKGRHLALYWLTLHRESRHCRPASLLSLKPSSRSYVGELIVAFIDLTDLIQQELGRLILG